MIDSRGRILGKISILDLGAALVIILVIIGIFVFPGTSGGTNPLSQTTKLVAVDILARGLVLKDTEALKNQAPKKLEIIVRNQPYGGVKLAKIQELPRTVSVPQPDGTVKAMPDPRPEVAFIKDIMVTITGQAQILNSEVVLGNQKMKIGTVVELEAPQYNFKGTIADIRIE